jgi:DNA-binding CsgD family transcriptional regulator/PAS domain-containing protein
MNVLVASHIPLQHDSRRSALCDGDLLVLDLTMNAQNKLRVDRLRDRIAQLEREKSQLLQMIAAAPVGFALLGSNLRFIRINPALKVIDGRLADEHIGQTLREAIPEHADGLESLCRRVLQDQKPILNVQISGVPVDGHSKKRTYLASLYPVRLDRKTLNIGLLMRDVSFYTLETIGRFSSVLTDDFNAILSAVVGSFDVKLDSLHEAHPAFTGLRKALQSNEQSAQLIRRLLGFVGKSGSALTNREQQILELIADGKSSQEIAKALRISFKTVVTHRSTIMKKLDAHETASLVRHAIRQGLLQP